MSWYYVDQSGQTQGPFEVSVMKQRYTSKQLTDESYVWNGGSVSQWTPLKQVGELLNQVKSSGGGGYGGGAPKRPARRKSPMGGGGRGNFLASIQKGQKLKKVEPKKEGDKPAPSGGGGGGGGGFGGGMDLMSQLKAKQAKLKNKGTIGKSSSPATNKAGPKPARNTGAAPKKTWGNAGSKSKTTNSKPVKKWGNASKTNVLNASSSSSSSSSINSLKSKLDSAEDWQIKAIEKILS